MTNPMVPAASFPPLHRTQGRGTHSSGTGTENTQGWATRHDTPNSTGSIATRPCKKREGRGTHGSVTERKNTEAWANRQHHRLSPPRKEEKNSVALHRPAHDRSKHRVFQQPRLVRDN